MSYNSNCGYSACSSCGYSTGPNADYSASQRAYNMPIASNYNSD